MEFNDFDHDERMIARERLPEDRDEKSLRPLTWADYSGQKQVTDNLKIFIEAAMRRGEALDHCLLYGPPGLGKTTLAGIIANEMGVNLRITTGPAIEKAGDLAALLTSLQEREVLFIDEIHRLNRSVEEVLYPAMEDFALDIMIGKGPAARSIRLDLPRFTLIGATTRAGMLSAPLRDRFGMVHRLELYKPDELKVILKRDADILNIGIDDEGLDVTSSLGHKFVVVTFAIWVFCHRHAIEPEVGPEGVHRDGSRAAGVIKPVRSSDEKNAAVCDAEAIVMPLSP